MRQHRTELQRQSQHDFPIVAVFRGAYSSMTLVEELFQLADDAADALARIRDKNLKERLSGLSHACDQAKRAWSGSNLGYHATVYYAGLEPKPSWVEFSPEWGMMDRWPTHQPDQGWHQMEHQAVIDVILARAGDPDIKAIEEVLAQPPGSNSLVLRSAHLASHRHPT